MAEELLFRGALQPDLGLGLTSLLFMFMHWPMNARLIPWTLSAGLRLGEEIRPVRLSQPTLWNLSDRLLGSGFLRGTLAATDWLDLYGGYELMTLEDPFDRSTSQAHAFTGGLAFRFGE